MNYATCCAAGTTGTPGTTTYVVLMAPLAVLMVVPFASKYRNVL